LALSRGIKRLFRFSGSQITRSLYDNGDCVERSEPIWVQGYINRWKNTRLQKKKMMHFQLEQHCDFPAFKSLLSLRSAPDLLVASKDAANGTKVSSTSQQK